jgi:hypothetical protein
MWKPIPSMEGKYSVSDTGLVMSDKKGLILKNRLNHDGYLEVYLSFKNKCKGYRVHRLVAQAFISNPENKPQVNHKNGIKVDNRVDNLEWCTCLENVSHGWANGLFVARRGILHSKGKVSYDMKCCMQIDYLDGMTAKEINLKYSIANCLAYIKNHGDRYGNTLFTIECRNK